MLQKYNSQLSLLDDELLIDSGLSKANDDDKYGSLKYGAKKSRNFGVNTSKALMFNNSFQLIQPITHLQFSTSGSRHVKKYESDGLDEEYCVPIRMSDLSPIHNSKSIPAKTQTTFNNKIRRNYQHGTRAKPTTNPEKVEPKNKYSRMQQIVDANIKSVEACQDIVRQSRRSNKTNEKNQNQDRPILKKNFKISTINSKLSESKLALKQEILLESKKMIGQNSIRKQIQNAKEEKVLKTSKIKNEEEKQIQVVSEVQNALPITLTIKISKLKRVLIEGQEQLIVNLSVPALLYQFPTFQTPNSDLKQKILAIFGQIGIQSRIVSIKKYKDRVELRNKNLCIIWNFDGKGYFGEWKGDQILAELNRHGVGFEWWGNGPSFQFYYGQFRDNKRQGYGVMKNKTKEVYIGCWKQDRKCGWGKLYGPDQKLKYKGEFISDQIININ